MCVCVCIAVVVVVFDLTICQLESWCYSLSSNSYMLKCFLVLGQVFPSSAKGVVYQIKLQMDRLFTKYILHLFLLPVAGCVYLNERLLFVRFVCLPPSLSLSFFPPFFLSLALCFTQSHTRTLHTYFHISLCGAFSH